MSKRTVSRPAHCGGCNPQTRQIEDADGSVRRCPSCHPLVPRPRTPEVPGPSAESYQWLREARRAIEHLADQPVPFAAEDVAALGIGQPDHPNHWGVAFQTAHREGVIVPVSITPSPRAARRGGLRRMWVAHPDRVAPDAQGGPGAR